MIKVVEFIHLDQDPDNIDLSKDLSLMRLEKKLSPDKVLKPCEYLDYSSLLYDLALYSIYDPEMVGSSQLSRPKSSLNAFFSKL